MAAEAGVTAWFTLAGAAVGVGLTGAFSIITTLLNRRWHRRDQSIEAKTHHEQEIRELRRVTYARFVRNIADVYQTLKEVVERADYNGPTSKPSKFRELVAEGESIRAELMLIASEPVLIATLEYRRMQLELIKSVFSGNGFARLHEHYEALLAAMRNDVSAISVRSSGANVSGRRSQSQ